MSRDYLCSPVGKPPEKKIHARVVHYGNHVGHIALDSGAGHIVNFLNFSFGVPLFIEFKRASRAKEQTNCFMVWRCPLSNGADYSDHFFWKLEELLLADD
jgi:hypothetical protein